MRLLKKYTMVLVCFCLLMGTCWAAGETRTVVDGRGIEVQVPAEIERVVTVSDGLIESTMFVLGEEDKIVGLGSISPQTVFNYTYPTVGGGTYEYKDGMHPVAYLYPRIRDLPRVTESGASMNFEALSGLEPDLVILRVGDTALRSMDNDDVKKTIKTIDALGIPLVVLKGPPCYDKPDLSKISDEIKIIGKIFGKEEKANTLAEYLESQTKLVFERTKEIPDAKRPTVLIFGASPTAREAGGVGSVKGTDTIDSYFIEEMAHARNAFRSTGQPTLSAEQLLSLNPEVIVLCTANGYHPPDELYSAPYYQNVAELSAVKNRRVMSLPWTPGNTKRLEYPIDIMVISKAAYPEHFSDIDLGEWLLDFYKNVYGVDEETAKALRSAQWMDWCVNK